MLYNQTSVKPGCIDNWLWLFVSASAFIPFLFVNTKHILLILKPIFMKNSGKKASFSLNLKNWRKHIPPESQLPSLPDLTGLIESATVERWGSTGWELIRWQQSKLFFHTGHSIGFSRSCGFRRRQIFKPGKSSVSSLQSDWAQQRCLSVSASGAVAVMWEA